MLYQILAFTRHREEIGDLVGNKIADRITKVSKTPSKNNSETNEEEIRRKRDIPPKLRNKIIKDLRLNEENYWLL